jgi:cysteine desulfurase / selenocysteine lyase
MNTNHEGVALPAPSSAEAVSFDELGPSFAGELQRLANQFFSASQGAGVAAPALAHPLPNALAVGAGGASPAVVVPPVPGPLQHPPPASSPLPTEHQLQGMAAQAPGALGLGPLPLALAGEAPVSSTPYFLELAGPPGKVAPLALPTSALGVRDFRPELAPAPGSSAGFLDPRALKRDFPILEERVHGKQLVWLDNAATTQKPRAVIERLAYFYEHENSNIHRAAHALAARATDAYEAARDKVRRFLNAPSPKEIVFVRGGTEAINLVAQTYGRRHVGADDEIVVTHLEHHANIVPWQKLAKEKGARLRVAPVDDDGAILLEDFERLLGPKTRIVAITHVSNALGTIVPVREMTAIAHRYGARVLVDGAQAVSHMPVDVQAIDCDFYCFSGHKVFAPTGIGALFGKAELLDTLPPWQGGGNMISDVTFEKTTYQAAPARFEAGTGNIADAVGLGAALDYVTAVGMPNIERYEHELLVYATGKLLGVPGLRMIGTAPEKAGVLSFVLDGFRTEDIGGALDREGIAVRSGHHCAQPILRRFGLESSVRASLAPYNTCEDIDALVAALLRLQAGHPTRSS